MQNKPAYLVLANGRIFKGSSIGSESDAIGEIVFTTSMTGYLATLTDVQTVPMRNKIAGYITRYLSHPEA